MPSDRLPLYGYLTSSDNDVSPSGLVSEALHSAAYSGIETPVNSLGQIWNRATGAQVGELGLVSRPADAEFGTARWHAQTVGGAAGMVAPFLLARGSTRLAGRGVFALGARSVGTARAVEMLNNPIVRSTLPILEGGSTGALFEFGFRPVEQQHMDKFWQTKAQNSAVGFSTFALLSGSNHALKSIDREAFAATPWRVNMFTTDLRRHVISGGLAGLSDAQARSMISGHGTASAEQSIQSAYTFAMLGGFTRSAGELGSRLNARMAVADVVNKSRGLQDILGSSEQGRMMLSDFGDARVSTGQYRNYFGLDAAPLSVRGAFGLVDAMSRAEARAAVAPGESWNRQIDRGLKDSDPHHRARVESARNDFQERGKMPEANWEQSRHAMVRQLAFINDILNRPGSESAGNRLMGEWRARWHSEVNPSQELAARLARPFNANHADPLAAEKYDQSMRASGPKKAQVVQDHLDPNRAQTLVDVGSADGFVPDALSRTNPNLTVLALDLNPDSFLGMLGKMDAYQKASAAGESLDGQFRPIPVFANGLAPKLPVRAIDAFSTLSNLHELVSYPDHVYGQFNPNNARFALSNWASSLRDGGRLIVKDFLAPTLPPDQPVVLKFRNVNMPDGMRIEGEPIAREYLQGRAAELWLREFLGEKPWRRTGEGSHDTHPQTTSTDAPGSGSATSPGSEYVTVNFRGNNLRYRWLPDGSGIECDARTAAEIMASSRYGMLETRFEMEGVQAEQFMNFNQGDYAGLFRRSSPLGYRLTERPQPESSAPTKIGADYVEHRQAYFDLLVRGQNGELQPVDLSAQNPAWHITFQRAYTKTSRPMLSRMADMLTGPTNSRPVFSPFGRIGTSTDLSGFRPGNPGPVFGSDRPDQAAPQNNDKPSY